MFDLDKITEILQTITRNKTRSLLTAFGVFWGIFMLVVLIGGGNGLDYFLRKQIGGFATNSALIWTNTTSEPYMGFRKGRWWTMKTQDLDILKQQMPEIEYIAGVNSRWDGTFIRGEKTRDARLRGVTPVYAKIHQPVMLMGRYINEIDVLEKRKVCVIGEWVYETLFMKGEDPIGQTVRWNDVALTVIGVYKPVSENLQINGNDNEMMVLPLSTMQLMTRAGDRLDLITFTAKPGYRISELEEKASQILKRQHKIAPHDKKAVFVMNIEKQFMMFNNLFLGINILVWIVGLGTLIAGVIGVSNIMMVTVKERTQEIGVRRALGARPIQILSQILSETAVLTGISGLMGIAFGVLVLQMADLGISGGGGETSGFQIPFWTAISATVVLLALSMLAGLLPAWRAMQIKAIDALRDE
ncbi:MAG: ABC transporter permease [Bacteroidales bacterium]|jgi:putative ABC transport system permease protein|nr:ABC transporter permease [Bacteroidales bacterium]